MPTETPTKVPTRTSPHTDPQTEPVRRYRPGPDHCPGQWVRTVRRIRSV